MMQESEPGRRIVSKREYVKAQARRTLDWGFVAAGIFAAMYWGRTGGKFWFHHQVSLATIYDWTMMMAFVGLALAGARQCAKSARLVDPGVPITRASAAHLPMSDSLVRASSVPLQEQEAVLLRAAAGETQPRDEEQLLRAAGGEQI